MGNGKIKVVVFTAITYLVTILFHIILQLFYGQSNTSALPLLGIPMVFPFISVIIVQKAIFKEKLKPCLGISLKINIWFLYAILIPVLMAVFMDISGIILLEAETPALEDIFTTFTVNILIGLSVATISALIEEFAWRGFLFEELKYLGIIKSSLLIGAIWSVWHIPVAVWYKYPHNPFKGVFINTLLLFVLSIIIGYIRYKSGSVIASAINHGILNTLFLSNSSIFFTANDVFIYGWIRILTGLLIIAFIILYELYSRKTRGKVIRSINNSELYHK